jgi:DNA (cytosine-5)-methyltransferase 1
MKACIARIALKIKNLKNVVLRKRLKMVTLTNQPMRFMSIDAFMRSLASNLITRQKDELLILDLFCGAGGATKGYQQAGFKVFGIDIKPQHNYIGDFFIQMNALDCDYEFLALFDMIHASPPCQNYSKASAVARKRGKEYPDLIPQTRLLLAAASKPYVMENVPEAPLRPDICLDGTMFDLGVIRKRVFETNIPGIPKYPRPSKIEGSVIGGDYVTVAGKGGGAGSRHKRDWEQAMQIDWMLKNELRESIPPAFTEWIGQRSLLILHPGLKLLPPPPENPRAVFLPKEYPVQARMDGF